MNPSLDMKGYLKFLILWLLSTNQMSGAHISHEIEKRKGSKPSPGTIYPVLKDLRTRGLIREVQNHKNKKIYGLTMKGKGELDKACTVFCRTFYDLRDRFDRI